MPKPQSESKPKKQLKNAIIQTKQDKEVHIKASINNQWYSCSSIVESAPLSVRNACAFLAGVSPAL